MTIETKCGASINKEVVHNYFKYLVNHFFKILPMRENNEESLITYMQSLQTELIGCQSFIMQLQNDSNYLTMLAILQYLIDHPDCSIAQVKREVFKAISLCNKIKSQFISMEV